MVNAEQYSHNHGSENRMPYLGKTFSVSESETKVVHLWRNGFYRDSGFNYFRRKY